MTDSSITRSASDYRRAGRLAGRLETWALARATALRRPARAVIDRLAAEPEVHQTLQFSSREWADLPTYHPESDHD